MAQNQQDTDSRISTGHSCTDSYILCGVSLDNCAMQRTVVSRAAVYDVTISVVLNE